MDEAINLDGQEFTSGQALMVLRAVKRMTTSNPGNELDAIANLYNTAIHVGLITDKESNIRYVIRP